MLSQKLIYTNHAKAKMRHYGISESLVRRVIRYPDRIEEAIVDNLVAAMKKTKSKSFPEVWVMYESITENSVGKLKLITAWRYPAESDARDPIPQSVLEEIQAVIRS